MLAGAQAGWYTHRDQQGDLGDLCGYPWPWSISQCLGQSSKSTAALYAVITLPSLKPQAGDTEFPDILLCFGSTVIAVLLLRIFLATDGLCDFGQVTVLQFPYVRN